MPLLTPGASRYKPLGLLKTGRYSCVTLVLEIATQQTRIARWFDRPPGATEVQVLEGIDREARALKALPVANITQFDKVVEGDGGTWMLFEWVDGILLSHYLSVEQTVPEAWILWWFYQLLVTLGTLHSATPPMVIGYLDPSDIVLVDDRLMIADLGLFEDMFPEVGASLLNKHPFLNFIAPEKRTTVQASPAVDLFSAAALAFWLATGHAPLVTGPRAQVLHLEALQRLRPELPIEASQLIAQMLDFYPSQRPNSAQDALDRLTPFVSDLRGQPMPAAPELDKYKFVAEATRPMVSIDKPPSPIFDASVSQDDPDAVAPTKKQGVTLLDDEPTMATPTMPVWQEALDDLKWQVRAHPLASVGLVLGIGLVLVLGIHAIFTPAPDPSKPSAPLVVVSGHVASKVDPRVAKYDGEWLPVTDVPIGSLLTVGSAGASLKFDHSTLMLQGNSVMTAEERDHGTVSVRLTRGQLRAQTASGDRLLVHLSGGSITVEPNSDVTAELGTGPCKIDCQTGSAEVNGGGSSHHLSSGSTYSL